MPEISVIVPVYKVENYLSRCVESILNQTLSDFEIILVDDGSPDNCPKLCDEYAEKYDCIISLHKENGGLSDARNFGIDYVQENSDSKYITFVDSDDWIHPQYLEILCYVLIKNEADVCCSKLIRTDKPLEMTRLKNYEVFFGNASELYLSRKIDITASTAKLYKKELFIDLHFPKGKWFEDDWIIPALLFSGIKIAALQLKMYYYFSNPNGITGVEWTTQKLDACLEVLRYQNDFFFQNQYYDVLVDRCRVYVDVFERHSQKNLCIKRNTRYVKKKKREIKHYIMRYKSFIPDIQQFGYEAWARRKTFVVKSYQKDYEVVKKEKGILYSILWKIKNYYPMFKEL